MTEAFYEAWNLRSVAATENITIQQNALDSVLTEKAIAALGELGVSNDKVTTNRFVSAYVVVSMYDRKQREGNPMSHRYSLLVNYVRPLIESFEAKRFDEFRELFEQFQYQWQVFGALHQLSGLRDPTFA